MYRGLTKKGKKRKDVLKKEICLPNEYLREGFSFLLLELKFSEFRELSKDFPFTYMF